MEVCNPKGRRTAAPASILAMLMMIMMLLNAYCCGAAALANSNTSFRCSGGRLDECLIEEDLELELGFLINPYVSRILTGGESFGSSTGNPDKPTVEPCGKPGVDNPSYSKCIHERLHPNNHDCDKKDSYLRCDIS